VATGMWLQGRCCVVDFLVARLPSVGEMANGQRRQRDALLKFNSRGQRDALLKFNCGGNRGRCFAVFIIHSNPKDPSPSPWLRGFVYPVASENGTGV